MRTPTPLDGLLNIDASLVLPASFACQRAFVDDPTTAYLIPDPAKRDNQHFAFEFGLRHSLLGMGQAYTTSRRCEGVALWLPADDRLSLSLFLSTGWPPLPLRCGWRHLWRDMNINGFLSRIRHQYAPAKHLYLALLAVDPEYQGRGFAGALLRPMLTRLHEQQLACYLETQNLKNVSMYEHFGFKLVHQTVIAHTDLPIYALLKNP